MGVKRSLLWTAVELAFEKHRERLKASTWVLRFEAEPKRQEYSIIDDTRRFAETD